LSTKEKKENNRRLNDNLMFKMKQKKRKKKMKPRASGLVMRSY